MRHFRFRPRSRRFLFVCATLTVVVLGGAAAIAYAGYPTGGVQVYTGCLTQQGNLANVAANATNPLHSCGTTQTLVHLSGGTITSVSPGTGLAGGGSDGSVSLSLSPGYRLPQTGCSSGQFVASDGSGGWSCRSQTTYSGTDFATSGQDCPAGQFATGVDSSGALKCAQPTLEDLQGSPCSRSGQKDLLHVAVDSSTGSVSMTCSPPMASTTVTNGSMRRLTIDDVTTGASQECDGAASCSLQVALGDTVRLTMTSGSDSSFNGSPFHFTCPGKSSQAALAESSPPDFPFTEYFGACFGTVTSDYAVTASFDS